MCRSSRARSARFGVSAEATFRSPTAAVSQPASGGSQSGRARSGARRRPGRGFIAQQDGAPSGVRPPAHVRMLRMAGAGTDDLACLDGAVTPASEAMIPVVDEGFLRGDGAFEVVRVYNGTPFVLDEHLDRWRRPSPTCGWRVAAARASSRRRPPRCWPARRRRLRRAPADGAHARRPAAAAHRAGAPRARAAAPGLRDLRTHAHPRRGEVALLRGQHAGWRASRGSAASTRRCS